MGAHVDLSSYRLGTVLVDPPRAGLGVEVASCLTGFERIVYISCNPETLRKDLQVLCKTHEIKRIAAFDQFPYTEHLEAGVLLVRKLDAVDANDAEQTIVPTSFGAAAFWKRFFLY